VPGVQYHGCLGGTRVFANRLWRALSEIRTGENRFKPQLWPFDPDIKTSKTCSTRSCLMVCPLSNENICVPAVEVAHL